jgi:hypothetical protein
VPGSRSDERFVSGTIARTPKAQLVEALLMGSCVPISKADICDRLPEVSSRTVEHVLSQLIGEGKVIKIGTYRDARYRRA